MHFSTLIYTAHVAARLGLGLRLSMCHGDAVISNGYILTLARPSLRLKLQPFLYSSLVRHLFKELLKKTTDGITSEALVSDH